jgi:hypothetical protein
MFNVVFCKPGTRIVTIESTAGFIGAHARLFASMGHRYGVIFGREDPADPAPSHRRWRIDIAPAVQAIERFVAGG